MYRNATPPTTSLAHERFSELVRRGEQAAHREAVARADREAADRLAEPARRAAEEEAKQKAERKEERRKAVEGRRVAKRNARKERLRMGAAMSNWGEWAPSTVGELFKYSGVALMVAVFVGGALVVPLLGKTWGMIAFLTISLPVPLLGTVARIATWYAGGREPRRLELIPFAIEGVSKIPSLYAYEAAFALEFEGAAPSADQLVYFLKGAVGYEGGIDAKEPSRPIISAQIYRNHLVWRNLMRLVEGALRDLHRAYPLKQVSIVSRKGTTLDGEGS